MPFRLDRASCLLLGTVCATLGLAGCGARTALGVLGEEGGSGVSGAMGAGGAGGGSCFTTPTVTSTTSSTPPSTGPATAWWVALCGGPLCALADSTRGIGQVDASAMANLVTNESPGGTVDCSVTGSSTFAVTAEAGLGDDGVLSIDIPILPTTATKAAPAIGFVEYESEATSATPYSSLSCDFYFEGNEGVSAGKVWVSFTCAKITDGEKDSTCALTQGYAVFENCSGT
jgi:hypothetical protein